MLRVKMGNKLFKLLSNRKNPYRIFVPLASWAEAPVGTKNVSGVIESAKDVRKSRDQKY